MYWYILHMKKTIQTESLLLCKSFYEQKQNVVSRFIVTWRNVDRKPDAGKSPMETGIVWNIFTNLLYKKTKTKNKKKPWGGS